ncbi:MAG TPA: hypothetical protein VIP11_09890 [Gemmatimonadaceae bacterium]
MTVSAAERRRGLIFFLVALIAAFVALRTWLGITPNADLDILGYNIHHLFAGILIVTATSIPLAIGVGPGRGRDLLVAGLGVGLGFVLDEWVYLIATPGTNADYLRPVSLIGGIVMIALAVVYALICSGFASGRGRDTTPTTR